MKCNVCSKVVVVGLLLTGIGFPRPGVAEPRKVMMAWETPDAYLGCKGSARDYIGSHLGQEVTDFAVGISEKSIAEADRAGIDLARQMINDIALAGGMTCWAVVSGRDTALGEVALSRYLVGGVVFDLSHERKGDGWTADFLRSARSVVDAAARRRELDIVLALRFGALDDVALLEKAKALLESGLVGLVIAPSQTLVALNAPHGVRLIADDQPTGSESEDYLRWFRRGFEAGFAGFCFPGYRSVRSDKVPFLSTSRLTRAALLEYESMNLIPWPAKVSLGDGRLENATIECTTDASLPPEGYRLSVGADGVKIASSDTAGRFYANQTLRQLKRLDGSYPYVEIEDAPRFRWRGVQMDESRHFFGKVVVKKLLDTMAQYKLNVFHWHLTDGDGWRLDIPGFPELVKYGAVRPWSDAFGSQFAVVEGKFRRTGGIDEGTYGPFFYTENDVKDILAYAEERHIEVVPEIDFPGHFAAALAAFPGYACDPSAASMRVPNCSNMGGMDGEDVKRTLSLDIARNVMCVGNDEAIALLEKVLSYVCRTFPSPYVNIGGDECPTACWRGCEKCSKRMKEEGLRDVSELQQWLTRHFVRFLESKGKRVMGYDEMLVGDVPRSVVGWYWRPERWFGREGMPGVRTMAQWTALGYDMVNCDWDYTYFYGAQGLDLDPFMYGHNVAIGKRFFGGDALSLEKVYSFDPARGVAAENLSHVLGGACSNWSEYTWNRYDFEWKLWPRGLAFAEVLWCGHAKPGFDDFLRRAAVERRRLIRRGVNCAPLAD